MKIHRLGIAMISVHLLSACLVNNEEPADTTASEVPFLPLLASSLKPIVTPVGKWQYGFPFYSSELNIYEDGSFRFHERGCLGHGYSVGAWSYTGTTILLVSDDSVNNTSMPVNSDEPDVYPTDTSFVFFDNVELTFEGDTLFRLDENDLKTSNRFSRRTIEADNKTL